MCVCSDGLYLDIGGVCMFLITVFDFAGSSAGEDVLALRLRGWRFLFCLQFFLFCILTPPGKVLLESSQCVQCQCHDNRESGLIPVKSCLILVECHSISLLLVRLTSLLAFQNKLQALVCHSRNNAQLFKLMLIKCWFQFKRCKFYVWGGGVVTVTNTNR